MRRLSLVENAAAKNKHDGSNTYGQLDAAACRIATWAANRGRGHPELCTGASACLAARLLGGFVGMAVSLLLLPARAHALMGEAANRVLQKLAQLLADLLAGLLAPSDAKAILARNDDVRRALTALENISDEAARERRNYLTE